MPQIKSTAETETNGKTSNEKLIEIISDTNRKMVQLYERLVEEKDRSKETNRKHVYNLAHDFCAFVYKQGVNLNCTEYLLKIVRNFDGITFVPYENGDGSKKGNFEIKASVENRMLSVYFVRFGKSLKHDDAISEKKDGVKSLSSDLVTMLPLEKGEDLEPKARLALNDVNKTFGVQYGFIVHM